MAFVKTTDLKGGLKILLDGAPCSVVNHEHIQPGKGQAFVRVTYRNLVTDRTLDKTFKSGESLELADVNELELQYLYNDGEYWHFMNADSYEQFQADEVSMTEARKWVSEEDKCLVVLWNGTVINVTAPNFVHLKVTQTEPGLKGDTSGGATKPATLSTGTELLVPLFVNLDDVLKIDTRTGEYVSRVKV